MSSTVVHRQNFRAPPPTKLQLQVQPVLMVDVNPWQKILSSRGPRAVQEFQAIKLPRFGDF